jgi:hypothetical protein
MAEYLSKSRQQSAGSGGADNWSDEEFRRVYPALWEYLSCDKWEDGTVRETATLLFFVDQERLSVCLTDRSGDRVAFNSGTTWGGLLAELEANLEDDSLEWRPRKHGSGGKSRR